MSETFRATDAELDAGGDALRQFEMAGRITRPWAALPNSDKRKWRMKAALVLEAAGKVRA